MIYLQDRIESGRMRPVDVKEFVANLPKLIYA